VESLPKPCFVIEINEKLQDTLEIKKVARFIAESK
jgi:hypothetical protein